MFFNLFIPYVCECWVFAIFVVHFHFYLVVLNCTKSTQITLQFEYLPLGFRSLCDQMNAWLEWGKWESFVRTVF